MTAHHFDQSWPKQAPEYSEFAFENNCKSRSSVPPESPNLPVYCMTEPLASPANHPRFTQCELVHESPRSTVWKCWDSQLDCWVAVKTAENTDSAAHACLLASLNHPSIVQAFGDISLSPHSTSSLILEYAEGKTLEKMLAIGERMPEKTAIKLLQQCCSALEILHQNRLVHGDLAPNNIIANLDTDTLKIIDFEIPAEHQGTTTQGNAAQGKAKRSRGTPVTMSPEVASGRTATPLSDIYSLGCIGFYLLTGKYVFGGATSLEICWKQIRQTCPSLSRDRAISASLAQLIDHMLQKSPSDRPQSATLVAGRLATISAGYGDR